MREPIFARAAGRRADGTAQVATPVRDILDELQRLELAGFFGGAAAELTELEQVLIAYAASVKCLALFHAFLIALYSLLIDRLVGLALVVGPVSGYYGAHVLSQCWVFIYLLFCIGCVVFGFWVFVSVAFRSARSPNRVAATPRRWFVGRGGFCRYYVSQRRSMSRPLRRRDRAHRDSSAHSSGRSAD